MVSSPLITSDDAAGLNKKVRQIDPRLFWVCNYEPTRCYAYSEDGLFLTGIQDLYKFAIDTNCVLKGFAFRGVSCICMDVLDENETKALSEAVNLIQSFRSVLDHNQSDMNGMLLSDNKEVFDRWVASVLCKQEPEGEDDFLKLNQELRSIALMLIQHSNTIIDRALRRPDKYGLIAKWIDVTLHWYCSGTHQDYYRSQLGEYYLARAYAKRSNTNVGQDARELRRKVNKWIRRQVTHDLESQIDSLRKAELNPSPQELAFKERFPEQYQQFISSRPAQIQEKERELEELETRIQSQYRGEKVEYFFSRLREQLEDTIKYLNQVNEQYTLLPQDLLHMDAMRVFGKIGSPDKDFR